jgi:CBS domain-containing protein
MSAITTVDDLHVRPVLALRGDATIADAARALIETDAGIALVLLQPVVEITERDIAAAIAEHASSDTLLNELQFGPPCFAHTGTTIDEALTLMLAAGRRALVVVDDDHALGVVRLADALEARLGETTWVNAFRVALHIDANHGGDPTWPST